MIFEGSISIWHIEFLSIIMDMDITILRNEICKNRWEWIIAASIFSFYFHVPFWCDVIFYLLR